MKQIKYLNVVLTIIACCLVVISLAVTGFIPTAKAEPRRNYTNQIAPIAVNADGSINVKFSPKDVMDVNIESCSGRAFSRAEPIEVKISN